MLNHGFLILDKPLGITSAKAVAEVKKILGCKKIGHGGTLDPLASGVLPLAVGEATKAFDYVAAAIKEYRFTVTFGEERDTDDSEGQVTQTTDKFPSEAELQNVLPAFMGTIMQAPPVYSAIKVDGERAYKRARAGEQIEMVARPIEVHSLKLTQMGPRSATFEVSCGKGTYVRSLARDISRKVNSLGYISALRRTRVGKFDETAAILLDKLPQFVHNAAPLKAWVPIEFALDDILAIDVDQEQARMLGHGRSFGINKPDGKYMALYQRKLIALVECANGMLKPSRVFNLN